jgi:hypothetical protein
MKHAEAVIDFGSFNVFAEGAISVGGAEEGIGGGGCLPEASLGEAENMKCAGTQ